MDNYIFSNEFYKNIDLMVYTTGLEKCLPGHAYGWAVRTSWMLHFILSGKGTYYCRGKEFHLKKGDFFLMIPGEKIYYQADQNDPWTYCWIGLQGIKAKEYMERSFLPEKLVAHTEEDSPLMKIVRMLEHIEYGPNTDLYLNALAYMLVYEIDQAYPRKNASDHPTADEYTESILTYVEQNFDQPLSINGISEYFALDRTYIHRLVKKAIGMSLSEYILSLRLANACSYLAFSDLSVSEIAHSVGYTDSLTFSKIFRKKKGMSPMAYRAKKRRSQSEDASNQSSVQSSTAE